MKYGIHLNRAWAIILLLFASAEFLWAMHAQMNDFAATSAQASLPDFLDDSLADDPDDPSALKQLVKAPLVAREQTRVAVLGYHNFSQTKKVTEMLMRTSEFRAQMEQIRTAGLTVISMQEFLEWRLGTRQLPERCVLITLDDGWRSVYTDAYPILKEYGYPFTLFLYTDYISGRGDSMSPEMIREMQEHGASIGSHSKSHPYPKEWRTATSKGEEALNTMLDKEFNQSAIKLRELFGTINTYCYPGGYNTPEMIAILPEYGYSAAFTVIPGKVVSSEDVSIIRRYMVFGTDHSIFARAIDFNPIPEGKGLTGGVEPGTLPTTTALPSFAVVPAAYSNVPNDIPVISADLSGIANMNLSSVQMRVSGFGLVPIKINGAERIVQWSPPSRIYMPNISVHLSWKTNDGRSHKAEWTFKVDQRVILEP